MHDINENYNLEQWFCTYFVQWDYSTICMCCIMHHKILINIYKYTILVFYTNTPLVFYTIIWFIIERTCVCSVHAQKKPGYPKSMQCNFNSCSFNYKSDYNTPVLYNTKAITRSKGFQKCQFGWIKRGVSILVFDHLSNCLVALNQVSASLIYF